MRALANVYVCVCVGVWVSTVMFMYSSCKHY